MEARLQFFGQKDFEQFLKIYCLGILVALSKKQIDINEAEKMLFRPNVVETLEEASIGKEILYLIVRGTELEDIESLIPKKLESEIFNMLEKNMSLIDELVLYENINFLLVNEKIQL